MTIVSAGPSKTSPPASDGEPPPGKERRFSKRQRLIIIGAALGLVALAAWFFLSRPDVPPGFARGNGRIEANEVYVATKYSGRVAEVLFDEGAMVEANQVVARMDTETLEAQLRRAQAQIREAESNRTYASAQVDVKQAELNFANQQHARSRDLVRRGAISGQEAEVDTARMLGARAELAGARAQVAQSTSAIEAARAEVERLQSDINDAVLRAPIRARVQSRLSEPGEVLDAGGRVLALIDLSDVYMYVFLPERQTGRIAVGSEARIVLDAASQYPINATVSFVSPEAQFTPRTVETEEERHNLTFRVKLQIPPERLREYEALVKSGLPGVGYVRIDNTAQWPQRLQVRPPPPNLWGGQSGGAP